MHAPLAIEQLVEAERRAHAPFNRVPAPEVLPCQPSPIDMVIHEQAGHVASVVPGQDQANGQLAVLAARQLAKPARDAVVTFADVELPGGRLADRLYEEQCARFPLAPLAERPAA